jgi:hypothetical protein
MNRDAALDQLAFSIGLRLMGPDERRKLRLALASCPGIEPAARLDTKRLERLEELLSGTRPPATLQDRLDVAAAEAERTSPPFCPSFWSARTADLIGAGFDAAEARQLLDDVRARVEVTPEAEGQEEAECLQ